MNEKGQAYSTFKLLIAVIVAMAIIAILIPIIMQVAGLFNPFERWEEEWACTPDGWREISRESIIVFHYSEIPDNAENIEYLGMSDSGKFIIWGYDEVEKKCVHQIRTRCLIKHINSSTSIRLCDQNNLE